MAAASPVACEEVVEKILRLPGPRGVPFAWAESRQELCETLPYYRAFHSGCYATSAKLTSNTRKEQRDEVLRDSTPFGYLLAGFGASRDAWEHQGRVIISHGGGKSGVEERPDDGSSSNTSLDDQIYNHKVHANGDQTMEDGQVASLVHSHQCQIPIVLLMAKDYKLSHFELPCAFAVLGWYYITDVWCEREPSKEDTPGWVRWKFRFQYIQSQGDPWWLGDEHVPLWNPKTGAGCCQAVSNVVTEKTLKRYRTQQWSSGRTLKRKRGLTSMSIAEQRTNMYYKCSQCQQTSPLVFQVGCMCLSQDCIAFWKLPNSMPISKGLKFSPNFLELRAEPPHLAHGGLPFSLIPAKAGQVDQGDALRGLHCTCGRLTCRKYDHYWHCAHCGIIRPCQAASKVHSAPFTGTYTGFELCKVHHACGIRAVSNKLSSDNLAVTSFFFPESMGGGEVHLIETIDGRQAEANHIYEAMQQGPYWTGSIPDYSREVIPFRRHPLSCHSVKGDLLSQQFTCNYGAEYKHSVKMGTVFLDQAPKSIKKALDLIKDRTRKVIPLNGNDDFNEVYPVKYRESQKMNFHDDGEPGLGPTVSSLSLGVEAKMMFRLKEKYIASPGRSDTVEGGRNGQQEERDKVAKGITMANRTLLTLTLRHGCIVIQHGRRLQEMIEHAVQPQMGTKQRGDNGVRIAVTARRIDKVSVEVERQI